MSGKFNSWRDVRDKFKSLADEQRGMPEDERLCVYRDRNPRAGDRGPFSAFFGPPSEMGQWTISNGPNSLFRKKFDALATRAGAKLCYGRVSPGSFSPGPAVVWLNSLYEHLLGIASPQLSEQAHGREVIKSVCEASAAYCARLETDARKAAASAKRWDTTRGKLGASQSGASNNPSNTRKPERLSATISCPSAAKRMVEHLKSKAIGQTDFASSIGTTDRTLRAFRKTGRVRRDIFKAIAKGMNITKEELLKPE
jgi:hypothetical protein